MATVCLNDYTKCYVKYDEASGAGIPGGVISGENLDYGCDKAENGIRCAPVMVAGDYTGFIPNTKPPIDVSSVSNGRLNSCSIINRDTGAVVQTGLTFFDRGVPACAPNDGDAEQSESSSNGNDIF